MEITNLSYVAAAPSLAMALSWERVLRPVTLRGVDERFFIGSCPRSSLTFLASTALLQLRAPCVASATRGRNEPLIPCLEQQVTDADEKFMREALLEAKAAALKGEVPVGAVLVSQGNIIARAHNLVETVNDPTAHAEIICIRNAARMLGSWRLLDSTLYVTLEPCPMCAGALLQARINTLVWGAPNLLLGADGSWVSLFPKSPSKSVDDSNVPKSSDKSHIHPFNPDINVRRGVLAAECSQIMKIFFQQRRRDGAQRELNIPRSLTMRSRFLQAIQSLSRCLKGCINLTFF